MRKCGKKDLCFQTKKYENLMCSTNRPENQQYGKYLHLETVPIFFTTKRLYEHNKILWM